MNKVYQAKRPLIKTGLFYAVSAILISGLLLSSCTTPKNAYYFKNLPRDTSFKTANRQAELKIRKNDLLSINFSSLNKEEDMTYNGASGAAVAGAVASGSTGNGYLVDVDGNIQVHKLGVVHAEGMTRRELKDKIQKDISPYLKDPVITVRYLNHKITVLGEVVRPTVIQMPDEQLSLLEALGGSGDVTPFARRDNILVIRETETGKQLKRINLEDHSLFTSEWYYLRPDDVVYVEPNDDKVKEAKRNKKQQTISLALSGATLLAILLNRIFP